MPFVSIAPDIEEHRAHLLGVGYRMTGSLADAEDAVQEAWLRLNRLSEVERASIRDQRAWLTTVVGRLCLDRLRSAGVRRETYIGPWLPEPLISGTSEDDPLALLVRDEELRMAAMVVLERLTPPQRVAFVLHDALSLPFEEVAAALGCSPATARQHATRARRAVLEARPAPRAEVAEQQRLIKAVTHALSAGDAQALVELLHPDVVMVNDSGGMAPAARREVHGAEKVARLLIGLTRRYGVDELLRDWTPVLVNGEQGYRHGGHSGIPESVTVYSLREGRIAAIYGVLSPAKLARAFYGAR
ncbi:sigma-70 family RNA polymerase sigma factor [Pseudonocardia eucalypti]|uniref:Sigma-70 family RNA polymerase sigma factor n=1 Tax=Pseudonocardia eucalypti TaxID=648755 RepID=A0ABP9QTD4_9PSEU